MRCKLKKQIVVLDGYTLNPGDLNWDSLYKLGELKIYDYTPDELILERIGDAEIILTNKTQLNRKTIEAVSNVKSIGVLATGYNVVDIQAATERNIVVTNIPTYGTDSVAQMVFAHLLNLTQKVAHHSQTVKDGKWSSCRDFCYWDFPLVELYGKTLGIVGLGRIGKAVARIAHAFGMKVVAFDKFVSQEDAGEITMLSLEELVSVSDVVSLHCPLTAKNNQMINAELLSKFKPTAFLINTSRGPLIDENALADALNSGQLAGAGLDVLTSEPPAIDNPLFSAANCFVTPHIAWATFDARKRLMDIAINNVRCYLKGKITNQVN
ncbi:MAG: D-2-hydroxyacid dehydrogenase [Candidatus Pacebacteria bacterium]|nr:D-2-hydroxyacid dehydrogenase [Candidatus Paceibacterota bacterium]